MATALSLAAMIGVKYGLQGAIGPHGPGAHMGPTGTVANSQHFPRPMRHAGRS
jgi:hypothetical protein